MSFLLQLFVFPGITNCHYSTRQSYLCICPHYSSKHFIRSIIYLSEVFFKWHIVIDHLTIIFPLQWPLSQSYCLLVPIQKSFSRPDILGLFFLHSGASIHYSWVSWPFLAGSYVSCLYVISSFRGKHYAITS